MSAVFSVPPAMLHRDFRRFWTHVCSIRDADGGRRGRLARVRNPPQCLRPGLIGLVEFAPVPLVALPAVARGPRPAHDPRLRLEPGGSNRRRPLLLVTIGEQTSLDPRARGADGRNPARLAGGVLAHAEACRRIARGRPRDALGRRSGRDHRGRAVGGPLLAIQPEIVYIAGAVAVAAALLVLGVTPPEVIERVGPSRRGCTAGRGHSIHRATPMILGAITLDCSRCSGRVALLPPLHATSCTPGGSVSAWCAQPRSAPPSPGSGRASRSAGTRTPPSRRRDVRGEHDRVRPRAGSGCRRRACGRRSSTCSR